eukprot:TRINITY_DN16952_c0_g1_i1.p1 TRINITY_DN16952_c0_g1~~TRINITY_DN16952_c0_g1_i1.p1  ORF type:complete len:149 (-),score=7.62 TRINITY_DN16952_c0_g1_i1:183-629(-)
MNTTKSFNLLQGSPQCCLDFILHPVPLIADAYQSNYGGTHVITETQWLSGSYACYEISQVFNALEFLVAQNCDGNSYNPGKWSRFDWTVNNGYLFYCQSAYDADTESEALNTRRADSTDPAYNGCGILQMTSWTKLCTSNGREMYIEN